MMSSRLTYPESRENTAVEQGLRLPLEGHTIAIAYDGLFPWSIGGAERWYRALAEGLVSAGARVTYITRLQWDEPPRLDGIEVVAVPGPREIYHPDGKRRADQPIRYAIGLLGWLLRNRGSVDALHSSNFPYFALLATRVGLVGTGKPVFVDWFEVWPRTYWIQYAGALVGRVGYLIQELCIRITPTALVFWDHTADRLIEHRLRGESVVLPGLLPEPPQPVATSDRSPFEHPTVFFSGRHIKDKGVRLLPGALSIARQTIPDLRMVIAGDGVETPLVKSMVEQLGLTDAVDFVGKLSDEELFRCIAGSACVAVPSVREGYGLAAVEAAAHGTPAVVTDGPENAAVGHIVEGRNGFVVSATPTGVADGIVKAVNSGQGLRKTTSAEFQRMSAENSMQRSIQEVISMYVQRLSPGISIPAAVGPVPASTAPEDGKT
jgi:glycosyltransferase involved in cell wall biosynthesis